jgi:excisionase family DNA binding protein
MTNEMLTVAEVAIKLKCRRETVIRLIQRGELEAITIGGRYRIDEEALEAYKRSVKVEVK